MGLVYDFFDFAHHLGLLLLLGHNDLLNHLTVILALHLLLDLLLEILPPGL